MLTTTDAAAAVTTKVTLAFSDGVSHELAVEPGQSVLDAGLAAGLPLLHQCKSGSCSSCFATLVEGAAETLSGCSSSLLAAERAEGGRLLCARRAAARQPKARCATKQQPLQAHGASPTWPRA